MAAEAFDEDKEARSGPGLVVSLIVCLVIGAGAGVGYGFVVPPQAGAVPEAAGKIDDPKKAPAHAEGATGSAKFPSDAVEIPIPTILATIGADRATNVRLDLSMIAIHGTPETTPLKSEIREDVIALLWGMQPKDLEGGRGFQNLRAELDERARVRGRGAILGLLIGALMIQ